MLHTHAMDEGDAPPADLTAAERAATVLWVRAFIHTMVATVA
jgi:hypothetical protein